MFNRSFILSLVCATTLGFFAGCNSAGMVWEQNIEKSGDPEVIPGSDTDPFDDGGGSGTTHAEDQFTQSATSGDVDIIWTIDSSGSMGNNQEAISENAAAFTDILEAANVDFKLMIVTTDPDDAMPAGPSGCAGTVITQANASLFGTCAVVGDNGSGWEEGLEATRRALVTHPSFLRAGADLQIIYVSDEEDQPVLSSWANHASASDLAILQDELAASAGEPPAVVVNPGTPTTHLADGGHSWDSEYLDIPIVAHHVSFLKGLKTGGEKIRTHAIVTGGGGDPFAGLNGSDDCHKRRWTEEIGKRYLMLASDPQIGGSNTDICDSWGPTMNQIALQATGRDKCFGPLTHAPDLSTVDVSVDGDDSVTFSVQWYQGQAKVCLNAIPAPGAVIVVSYDY